jgi:hypothetical protein
MPDWGWTLVGAAGGVALGLGIAYVGVVWYWTKDRTW